MSDGIYVSMNGASARMAQLESISDNLANAQTPGFKAERPSFESFLAKGDLHNSSKVYPAAVATQLDLSNGAVVQTGNPLDVVPSGKSFLGVQTSTGVALTRNGHLQVERDGGLTAAGRPVIGRDGNAIMTPLGARVHVDTTGSVFANNTKIAELALFEVNGPVDRIGPSLLAPHDQKSLTPSADTLRLGEIETGNASPLEAAVQLVSAQRHFETSMQALQTYRRMDERASEVGRVR
ncbi:MAG: flagellar hook basal-body protein [Archangium sp.]|nr:flagellar hook basal-body protein [Archangium sp.]